MSSGKAKIISLYLMALLYVAAGINHFLNLPFYLEIMPPWLPWHSFLVNMSGVLEIGLGLLLLFKPARPFAAWGIIGLLVAVFPANIQMLQNFLHDKNPWLWMAILRLPVQLLLIGWAFIYAKKEKGI